jgi:hypothetical protein
MKTKIYMIVLMSCLFVTPVIHAEEYGKIRALQQRASDIVKLRNNYVAQVLTAYTIPHEQSEQGAVLRIYMDGKWLDITGIEIIPILKESTDKRRQVIAHEIFFYTESGVLGLMSELAIR